MSNEAVVMPKVLEQTAIACKSLRGGLWKVAQALYRIREEKLFDGHFTSYTDYVENYCGMDMGQVSKMLTSYEHYVVNGSVELAQLEEANIERLYLARTLEGTPVQQAVKALHLSKQDIKAQKIYEQTGAEHEHEPVTICKVCGKRL